MVPILCLRTKLTKMLPLTMLFLGISCSTTATTCACPTALSEDRGSVGALGFPAEVLDNTLLVDSWKAYRDRFIQTDGRVIDRENRDRTVSEGQAYAMLRAVAINDPETFLTTYTWAENNLARKDAEGNRIDSLWAWKWGQKETGEWATIDPNFASDADIDAITALILAAYRWNCPEYLEAARVKLADLWQYGTVVLPDGSRQLLPGPEASFWPQPEVLILNPSYFSPASFRLFAQVDPDHDWSTLIETGYTMLEESSAASPAGLPADWIAFDPSTNRYGAVPARYGLQSNYSFDAYRVWWRIALDASWYQVPRAEAYLSKHLNHLVQRWEKDRTIPARLSLGGEPLAYYEATSQYAMIYPALAFVNRNLGEEIYLQKIQPTYQDGFWDSDTAYYTQNLVWMGLSLPELPPSLFERLNDSCPAQEDTS